MTLRCDAIGKKKNEKKFVEMITRKVTETLTKRQQYKRFPTYDIGYNKIGQLKLVQTDFDKRATAASSQQPAK